MFLGIGIPYYLAHSTMVLWPVCTTFDSSGNGLISKHGLIQKEYGVLGHCKGGGRRYHN